MDNGEMPKFDFIEDPRFRASLEADYAELHKSNEHGAWKSVHVLGGSIVEALLIDYLVATQASRSGKDPLKMDLADAVSICRSEGVLSDRTADLCSVVRSYRNLIHPGRIARLNEDLPSESSARIAAALIELICDEVASVRQSAFGLTGEQIVSKLERDSHALAILKHLLEDVSDSQKERILIGLLPERYFELKASAEGPFSDFSFDAVRRNLERGFRVIFENSPDTLKAAVVQQFVSILREGEGERVMAYAEAFLSPGDLEYLPENQRSLVKDFIFSRVGTLLHPSALGLFDGIEKYLTAPDVNRWVDPIVRAIASGTLDEKEREEIRTFFVWTAVATPSELDSAIAARVESWIRRFEGSGREADAESVRSSLSEWKDMLLPF